MSDASSSQQGQVVVQRSRDIAEEEAIKARAVASVSGAKLAGGDSSGNGSGSGGGGNGKVLVGSAKHAPLPSNRTVTKSSASVMKAEDTFYDKHLSKLGTAPRKRVGKSKEEVEADIARGRLEAEVAEASAVAQAFFDAAVSGNLEKLRQMVAEKACPIDVTNADGWTAMHFAASCGNVESLEALLDLQLDDEKKDKQGRTPLHIAAANGRVPALELFIDIGCELNERAGPQRWNPLFYAAQGGHIDAIGTLVHADADLLITKDGKGRTALEVALAHQKTEAADALEMAEEARGVRSRKEKKAAAARRRASVSRGASKRELRRSSTFKLEDVISASASDSLSASPNPLRRLSRTFRRASQASNVLQVLRRRSITAHPTFEVEPPAVSKSKSASAELPRRGSGLSRPTT